jgi:hypothetical protein
MLLHGGLDTPVDRSGSEQATDMNLHRLVRQDGFRCPAKSGRAAPEPGVSGNLRHAKGAQRQLSLSWAPRSRSLVWNSCSEFCCQRSWFALNRK